MGTTAEKLTYLNETKSLLKDSINSLGGEITSQTTFRQYATELDSIYSRLPKVSGTGSILSLSPTLKGRLGIVPKGDTYQKTNLYNNDIEQGAISDGANVSANNRIRTAGYIEVVPSTQLYIGFSGCDDIFVSYYNSSKTFVSAYGWETGNSNISIPANIYYIRVAFRKSDNSNITPSSISNVQIGNVPNPDYPQEIKSVTGLQKVSVGGKNLFDKDNANILKLVPSGGTNMKYVSSTTDASIYIPIVGGKTYTVSRQLISNRFSIATSENIPALNGSLIDITSSNNATSLTLQTSSSTKYLCVYLTNDGTNFNEVLNKLQIEQGSTATDYEPYQTPQEYEINLGNIHLYENDQIIGTPNNWSVKHVMGEVVLDGSETYTSMGWTGGRFGARTSINNLKQTSSTEDTSHVLSDYYKTYTQTRLYDLSVPNYGISNRVNQSEVVIRNDNITTINDFKTWLSTHNTKVVYELAEPTTEPITNTELIEDLNNLYYAKSYNGQTNISVEGDLPMILSVSALKGE